MMREFPSHFFLRWSLSQTWRTITVHSLCVISLSQILRIFQCKDLDEFRKHPHWHALRAQEFFCSETTCNNPQKREHLFLSFCIAISCFLPVPSCAPPPFFFVMWECVEIFLHARVVDALSPWLNSRTTSVYSHQTDGQKYRMCRTWCIRVHWSR